jgi:hypothetical protein
VSDPDLIKAFASDIKVRVTQFLLNEPQFAQVSFAEMPFTRAVVNFHFIQLN